MVITFFDDCSVMYTYTYLMKNTINAQYYIAILNQLMKDHIPKKRPDLCGK